MIKNVPKRCNGFLKLDEVRIKSITLNFVMTKSDDEFWSDLYSRPSGKKHSACPEIEDQFIWSWSNFASFIVMESQLQKFWYHWIIFKKKSSLKSDLSYGFMELALPITLSICLPCLSTPQLVENWKLDQIDHPSRRFQYLCSISIFPEQLARHSNFETKPLQ